MVIQYVYINLILFLKKKIKKDNSYSDKEEAMEHIASSTINKC